MSLKKIFEKIGINPKWGNVPLTKSKESEEKSGSFDSSKEKKLVPEEKTKQWPPSKD